MVLVYRRRASSKAWAWTANCGSAAVGYTACCGGLFPLQRGPNTTTSYTTIDIALIILHYFHDMPSTRGELCSIGIRILVRSAVQVSVVTGVGASTVYGVEQLKPAPGRGRDIKYLRGYHTCRNRMPLSCPWSVPPLSPSARPSINTYPARPPLFFRTVASFLYFKTKIHSGVLLPASPSGVPRLAGAVFSSSMPLYLPRLRCTGGSCVSPCYRRSASDPHPSMILTPSLPALLSPSLVSPLAGSHRPFGSARLRFPHAPPPPRCYSIGGGSVGPFSLPFPTSPPGRCIL